jgi:hypothetical protein
MGKIAEHIGHGHMSVRDGRFYRDICPERDEADINRKVAAVSLADPFHDQIGYPVDRPSDQGEIDMLTTTVDLGEHCQGAISLCCPHGRGDRQLM